MIYTIIAVAVMIVILLIYGAIMLFTDYIKIASYVKAMIINIAWFIVATGYRDYDIYYPDVFGDKWLNFGLTTVAMLLLVFEISKFIKLRNAFLISSGTVTHLLISLVILNFCGGVPGWVASVYLTVSSCIVLGIHIAAIYNAKTVIPGNIFSRLLAGILIMPAPFLITSACMLSVSTNREKVIDLLPFKEFVNRLYEFVSDPQFNYTGRIMFTGLNYTRKMFLVSLIISIIVFIAFVIFDSSMDFRSKRIENNKHRKEAEKERIRKEISTRIHDQIDKIDSCMAYISSNYKNLKVKDSDMAKLRNLYDEANRIKYSYNGAASGPILKRLTEIKTEIFIIRDRIVNHMDLGEDEEGNGEGANNSENGSSSGFFNGCTSADEIKKRYRDLCKVFHPDSGNGDQETFLTIKNDYERLMQSLEEGN